MEKYAETRPWGKFEQFSCNELCTVKILTVNPNSSLSLQKHEHRNEFWRVIAGEAYITVGAAECQYAKAGDEFYIHAGALHRIRTAGLEAKILEISFGKFDENDIIRLEDLYGRA